ncbi:hypothetical protein CB0940_06464 [Cercospora beticola]|uniref:Uncharacterized protein n=1 Tax=Cercospora beticola TaxID=122368 RepID=A0A2G5HX45_CERBT|nr:hypothetical protein CB0940_06464 [Cercospora beticola]PIA97081.1 hypothetical protein CB0940_06464 [Cercospora beticola]WPA99102.1 hypothetical protein RHO25_003717 [Cercospora beticola]CAK1360410.1 unnamed protein product [Cercospora beticola]
MFLLRTFRTATAARVAPISRAAAPFTTSSFRFASGDYGSGAHKHGKELEKESHDKEHPGPPPPSTGGKSKSSESSQPSSSGSSSGQSQSNDGAAAQPKILNDARPAEGEESEEVRKHNEEFRKRADRQQDGKKDDKVDKEFWKGQGGVDREP